MLEHCPLNGCESCMLQHGFCRFPAPHGTQPLTALAKGYWHTVTAGNRIQQGCQREIEIILKSGRSTDILHQVVPPLAQGAMNRCDKLLRIFLIMYCIKRGDQIKFGCGIEVAQVSAGC